MTATGFILPPVRERSSVSPGDQNLGASGKHPLRRSTPPYGIRRFRALRDVWPHAFDFPHRIRRMSDHSWFGAYFKPPPMGANEKTPGQAQRSIVLSSK